MQDLLRFACNREKKIRMLKLHVPKKSQNSSWKLSRCSSHNKGLVLKVTFWHLLIMYPSMKVESKLFCAQNLSGKFLNKCSRKTRPHLGLCESQRRGQFCSLRQRQILRLLKSAVQRLQLEAGVYSPRFANLFPLPVEANLSPFHHRAFLRFWCCVRKKKTRSWSELEPQRRV